MYTFEINGYIDITVFDISLWKNQIRILYLIDLTFKGDLYRTNALYMVSRAICTIHNKFSGAPLKSLCWQGEDNFSWLPPWLPGFVNAVATVVRGNRARNQQSSPCHQAHHTSFFDFVRRTRF